MSAFSSSNPGVVALIEPRQKLVADRDELRQLGPLVHEGNFPMLVRLNHRGRPDVSSLHSESAVEPLGALPCLARLPHDRKALVSVRTDSTSGM
jgi:hypothetical protein